MTHGTDAGVVPGELRDAAAVLSDLEVEWDARLGPRTSLKVGGSVAALVTVRKKADLERALGFVRSAHLPFAVLGAGSNLLVPDGLTRAVVIRLGGSFRDVRISGTDVRAGAAVKLGKLSRMLAAEGLAGLGFAAGIPGTVGGSVVMNAGYGGRAMADVLVSALCCGSDAKAREVAAAELGLSYRQSRMRKTKEIVLAATIRLERGDPALLREEIQRGDAHRAATQPLSAPSCGSVFKNPLGDFAGRLIDAAGLKGTRIGGAEVSRVHANFFVTVPGSPARDVLELIALVQARVREQFGVDLESEVVDLATATTQVELA